MPRLPVPGRDQGSWGQILNDYLMASHQADGTLKTGAVGAESITNGSVTQTKLSATGAANGQVLSTDGTNLSWATPTGSGSVPDATASVKGLVQLTGDLGGTAASPTVPGLAGKANTSHVHAIGDVTNLTVTLSGKADTGALATKSDDNTVVHLSGNEIVTGTKNFTGTLQTGGQTVVATNDARLTDQRTPADNSISAVKLQSDSVTEPKLAISNAAGTGQVLSWNGSALAWVNQSGSGDPSVGGDLTGTASNAQIAANAVGSTEIASSAVTKTKLSASGGTNGQVLSTDGTSLSWVTPSGGGGAAWTHVNRTSAYTASSGEFITVNSSGAGFTITLPGAVNGAYVYVKKIDSSSNAIIVQPASGTIDGAASVVVNQQWEGEWLMSDGTNWFRL